MPLTPTTRYAFARFPDNEWDYSRIICRDCSSRTHVVQIPADEQAEHDAWHDEIEPPTRHAVLKGRHADLEAIRRYLPHNYWADSDGGNVWIHGYDNAGWTLDGYVIPRLASGLYFATEVQV